MGFQGLQGLPGSGGGGTVSGEINPVKFGFQSGIYSQSINSTALGVYSGYQGQGTRAVAIGFQSGMFNQGSYAVAIGHQAGRVNQPSQSIVINATTTPVNPTTDGLFITPIREANFPTRYILGYEPDVNGEILSTLIEQVNLSTTLQGLLNIGPVPQSDVGVPFQVQQSAFQDLETQYNLIYSGPDTPDGAGRFLYTDNIFTTSQATIFGEFGISLCAVGDVWTATDTTREWKSISMSTSGQYQTAIVGVNGYIYTSNDYGLTFTERAIQSNWTSVSVSSNGQYQNACSLSGLIYISSDFGVNWTEAINLSDTELVSIDMTTNGQKQIVASQNGINFGQLYVSTNFGVSWSSRNLFIVNSNLTFVVGDYKCVATNADGSKTIAMMSDGNYYTSNNLYYTAFTFSTAIGWKSVSMNVTGQYILSSSTDGLYLSTNYGNNFTQVISSVDIVTSSISASGQYQIAGGNNTFLYISTDFGNTWTTKKTDTLRTWTGVSISSSGQYLSSVANNSQIFISNSIVCGTTGGGGGSFNANINPIAIGIGAGNTNQSLNSVAIGTQAGYQNQSPYSIALGYQAGYQQQASNSIILNATNTQLNSGTTGFFVNPIRFNQGFNASGLQGVQGVWGFQGNQGGLAGTNTQIQYNNLGVAGASPNLTFNPSNTVFTFGAGQTGGQFNVIGTLVQGVTGTTGQAGNCKFGYRNVGRFVEVGADSVDVAYIDFHSKDGSDVDYDSRILSTGGTTNTMGGGALQFYADGGYIFNGANTTVSIPNRITLGVGSQRSYGLTKNTYSGSVGTGTIGFVCLSSSQGGLFYCSASNSAGNWTYTNAYAMKINSPTSLGWSIFNTNGQGSLIVYNLTTTSTQWVVQLNNTTGNTVYWMVDALLNPFYI